MKENGTHEGCIEQMERLFSERLYTADKKVPVDSENRIRVDDLELDPAVQAKVDEIMPKVTEENVAELTDLAGIRHDFLMINGFDVPVPVLDEPFNLALIGTKGKWYDHEVIVSNPEKLE